MNLNEQITKAQQGMWFVVQDLDKAHALSNAVQRPEGQNRHDKVMTAYLEQQLKVAQQLYRDLQAMGD